MHSSSRSVSHDRTALLRVLPRQVSPHSFDIRCRFAPKTRRCLGTELCRSRFLSDFTSSEFVRGGKAHGHPEGQRGMACVFCCQSFKRVEGRGDWYYWLCFRVCAYNHEIAYLPPCRHHERFMNGNLLDRSLPYRPQGVRVSWASRHQGPVRGEGLSVFRWLLLLCEITRAVRESRTCSLPVSWVVVFSLSCRESLCARFPMEQYLQSFATTATGARLEFRRRVRRRGNTGEKLRGPRPRWVTFLNMWIAVA